MANVTRLVCSQSASIAKGVKIRLVSLLSQRHGEAIGWLRVFFPRDLSVRFHQEKAVSHQMGEKNHKGLLKSKPNIKKKTLYC